MPPTPVDEHTEEFEQLAEAHSSLAMALEDGGQRDRALTEYRTAVRLAPDAAQPALNLGILLASGHPAAGSATRGEALRMLQSAVRGPNLCPL